MKKIIGLGFLPAPGTANREKLSPAGWTLSAAGFYLRTAGLAEKTPAHSRS